MEFNEKWNVKTSLSHSGCDMLQDKIIILYLIFSTFNSNKEFYGAVLYHISVKKLTSGLEKLFMELLIKT
jgi:hypothetical protein